MTDDEKASLALGLLTGIAVRRVAALIMPLEDSLFRAIAIIRLKLEEEPDHVAVPMMLNLLIAALDLISAHKVLDGLAETALTGCLHLEGSERIQ